MTGEPPHPGRWTVELDVLAGHLSLKRPTWTPRHLLSVVLPLVLSGCLLVSCLSGALKPDPDPLTDAISLGLMVLCTTGYSVLFLQATLNSLQLDVADGRVLLRTGPVPRWSQQLLQAQWIQGIGMEVPELNQGDPSIRFDLQGRPPVLWKLAGCSVAEARFAVEQVRVALRLAQPGA